MMKTKFLTYAEIPYFEKEYILTVANVKNIEELPLEDINGMFEGFAEYEKQKVNEEYEDGWVM